MRTPEGKVKDKIKAVLKTLGVYYFMPRGTAFGRAGVPDFICCCDGNFFAIEAKAGNNTLTALQEKERDAIEDSGGLHFIVTDDPQTLLTFRKFIEGVLEGEYHVREGEEAAALAKGLVRSQAFRDIPKCSKCGLAPTQTPEGLCHWCAFLKRTGELSE